MDSRIREGGLSHFLSVRVIKGLLALLKEFSVCSVSCVYVKVSVFVCVITFITVCVVKSGKSIKIH